MQQNLKIFYTSNAIVKMQRVITDIKAYVLEARVRGELRKWNRTKRRPGSLMNSACYTRMSRGLYDLPTNARRLEFANTKHQMANMFLLRINRVIVTDLIANN